MTLVEPSPYGADRPGVGATRSDESTARAGIRTAISRFWGGGIVGDPKAVDAGEPPLQVFFGTNRLM